MLTSQRVRMTPEEAELAKLFTNAWRYIKFAAANQLYMIANDRGLDFERIRQGLMVDYPRAADLPAAGFAAGPCLLKDTMQLAGVQQQQLRARADRDGDQRGPAAVSGRPAERRYDLASMAVGILGMAFKGGSDDIRSSLAYKLKRILAFVTDAVYCTDPYVTADASLLPLEDVVAKSDLLIIAAPHPEYAALATDKPIVDIWNIRGEGVQV